MSGCSPYGSINPSGVWGGNRAADQPDAPVQEQPLGVNAQVNVADAIRAVSEVAARVLNSKRTERGAAACYESCGQCCEGACGCPKCGCPEGECGCGSIGSCLCHFWDLFCLRGEGSNRKRAAELVMELEAKYGPVCLLMAERSSGVNLEEKMENGNKITRQEKSDLEDACKRASKDLAIQCKKVESDYWFETQKNCLGLLDIPGMEEALLEGVSMTGPPGLDPGNLKIIDGGSPKIFDIEEMARELFLLKVNHVSGTAPLILGVVQLSGILQLLLCVLTCFCDGGRRWLTKDELMALICFLLALRGYGVVNSRGVGQDINPICTGPLGASCMPVIRGSSSMSTGPGSDSPDGRSGGTDPYDLKGICQRLREDPGASGSVSPHKQFKLLKQSGPLVKALIRGPQDGGGSEEEETDL